MNYKMVLHDDPFGTKLSLFKKHWLWGWNYIGGLKAGAPDFLIKEFTDRWEKMYKGNLIIVDNRNPNIVSQGG